MSCDTLRGLGVPAGGLHPRRKVTCVCTSFRSGGRHESVAPFLAPPCSAATHFAARRVTARAPRAAATPGHDGDTVNGAASRQAAGNVPRRRGGADHVAVGAHRTVAVARRHGRRACRRPAGDVPCVLHRRRAERLLGRHVHVPGVYERRECRARGRSERGDGSGPGQPADAAVEPVRARRPGGGFCQRYRCGVVPGVCLGDRHRRGAYRVGSRVRPGGRAIPGGPDWPVHCCGDAGPAVAAEPGGGPGPAVLPPGAAPADEPHGPGPAHLDDPVRHVG
jgi:hypothetical protein